MSIRILTEKESIEAQKERDRWWKKLDEHWKIIIYNCFEHNIFHKIKMDTEWRINKKRQLKCKHEYFAVVVDGSKTTYCPKCGKVLKEGSNGKVP